MGMSEGFWKLDRLERLPPQVTSRHLRGQWQTPTRSHPPGPIICECGSGGSLGRGVESATQILPVEDFAKLGSSGVL